MLKAAIAIIVIVIAGWLIGGALRLRKR